MIVHPPFAPHPEVCTWSASPGEIIGLACQNCGHTNLVHGNVQNQLDECALCRLIVISRHLAEQLPTPALPGVWMNIEGEKGDQSP